VFFSRFSFKGLCHAELTAASIAARPGKRQTPVEIR